MSNLLTSLKGIFGFDDAMDIYACHGVAGIVGLVFTGVFAQCTHCVPSAGTLFPDPLAAAASVTFNDGYSVIPGGWMDRHWKQVGYQLIWVVFCWAWCVPVAHAATRIADVRLQDLCCYLRHHVPH